ncbi:methionine sulfoxide reductase [Planococcus sp. N064]|uniref:Methionine sulfoxide reductase n=1 Tax=Planococcus liqunii TaxID=3058394 RepID=A0ABT8MSB8_9BACL|nr:methionine sulfoxide reductase [Planococcus sp. N064]MDN7227812.1 methionine sulfoxide reductase [Planococcus sp. N064]
MAKEVYLRKIIHDTHGELYQFLQLDPPSGEEKAVSPFEMGMFKELEQQPELLYIQSKRGANAVGYCKGQGFVVKQGSKFAATTSPKCPKKYVRSREKLVLEKRLIPFQHQLLVMEDIEFDSPQAAMGAVIGGWVRGAHGWKEKPGT